MKMSGGSVMESSWVELAVPACQHANINSGMEEFLARALR
jgi:hypothetical protein